MRETDESHQRLALEVCRRGIAAGQTPFGAAIVRDGEVLAAEHNQVWAARDPTAHAEVQAIRSACSRLGSVHLEGAAIYTTTEPCPMCFSAIHWARIKRIGYGASIADAASFGFNELGIPNRAMKELGGLDVDLVAGLLADEALALFRSWRARGASAAY